jgi:hypothetical protein
MKVIERLVSALARTNEVRAGSRRRLNRAEV